MIRDGGELQMAADYTKKKLGSKMYTRLSAIAIIISVLLCCAVSPLAVSDAVLRASGDVPAAKTDKTIRAEKELEKLTAKEKTLKEQISAATINRSKLLAQKRADLRQIRQKRDEEINKIITEVKAKKAKQATLVGDLKKSLATAKKNKNKVMITSLEMSIVFAGSKLNDINAELKKANDKLAQSYKDYKSVYDQLTRLDAGLKKILDINLETEKKIKDQKIDYKNTKTQYKQSIKIKDFLTAERRMDSLVFIQTGILDNYAYILDIKLKVKSDYYEQIVNYRI